MKSKVNNFRKKCSDSEKLAQKWKSTFCSGVGNGARADGIGGDKCRFAAVEHDRQTEIQMCFVLSNGTTAICIDTKKPKKKSIERIQYIDSR